MSNILKIALVLETSGGGSGRHVLDLAEELTVRGHAVTIVWATERAHADFTTRLTALDAVRAIPVSMHRAVGLHDARSLRALAAILREEGPFDVLHGHSSKAGALIRLLPRDVSGARIYTPHAFRTMDPGLSRSQRWIYGGIERLLAQRTARLIAVSDAERQHARDLRIASSRVAVVVNGVRLPEGAARISARAQMGLSEHTVAVGFIGRLDHQKDPVRFVRSIAAAAARTPAVRGIVVGDGPLRGAAEAAGRPDTMRFLGWQDGPQLMSGLDIFCMTSRYEAMPYTLLEALHAGVPIVTTDIGGAAESVAEGVNGSVLPVDAAPEEIGEILAALAQDSDRRTTYRQAALRMASEYTIGKMVESTLDVYAAALGRGTQAEAAGS